MKNYIRILNELRDRVSWLISSNAGIDALDADISTTMSNLIDLLNHYTSTGNSELANDVADLLNLVSNMSGGSLYSLSQSIASRTDIFLACEDDFIISTENGVPILLEK